MENDLAKEFQKEDKPTSNIVKMFKAKCETALSKVQNLDEFRKSDAMVDFIFKVGRELFDKPLDTMNPDGLVRLGGKLAGALPYIGQKSSYAKAESLVYEQKHKEVSKDLVLDKLARDTKYKVTQARAEAEIETTELSEFVIQKTIADDQWDNIKDATASMLMFVQSAIKVKEAEKFTSSRVQNNG